MNDFDGEFNKLKDVKRSEDARMISLKKVMARSNKKKFKILPLVFSGFTVFAVGLFLMMTVKEDTPVVESGKTIIDEQTVHEVPIVELTSRMFTVEYEVDNMDRGNHDYETLGTGRRIAVDPGVLDFHRGDVIYFTTPEYSNGNSGLNLPEHYISRVVALPGEKIEIKKGQIFIDDKKLKSFYSYPTVRGRNKEEYLKTVNPENSAMNEEDFEENMESILVSKGSVFVIGDQWWRSIDSRHFGLLSLSKVEGKVIGYRMEQ